MHLFEGIYPAVLTPFDSTDRFAPQAYQALIDHLYKAGVHGIYVCGVTGEGLTMSPDERERVAEVAVAASRDRGEVLVNVGGGNTQDSVRLAKHAVRIGADGVGSLAPLTNPYGVSLVGHFSAVADAAQPLPALVYYNPEVAPSLNSYESLEPVLDLPLIAGVKFTGTDAAELAYAIYERSHHQTILTGVDEMLVALQLMGAHGAVGALANVVPELFVEIYDLAKEGKWRHANEVQRRLLHIIRVTERYPFISALKNIARWQGNDCGEARHPQLALTPAQQSELYQGLETLEMRFPLAAGNSRL